jgi:hypothetical protein
MMQQEITVTSLTETENDWSKERSTNRQKGGLKRAVKAGQIVPDLDDETES